MESTLLFLILQLFIHSFTLEIDDNDLLEGEGLFSSANISAFTIDSSHTTDFITQNNSNILKLQKPEGQSISFQTGIAYYFQSSQPQHVQFKFASTNPDTEDSNLRISDQSGNTIVLFRAGKGGLIRVNEQQMIDFYNSSVSTDSLIHLTQVDLKLNWTEKSIDIFVNSTYKATCNFFNDSISSVNKLLIYNLFNSVSYWQDIVVCRQICYSFNSGKHITTIGFGLIAIFMILLTILGIE